jgi:hypothetical protein
VTTVAGVECDDRPEPASDGIRQPGGVAVECDQRDRQQQGNTDRDEIPTRQIPAQDLHRTPPNGRRAEMAPGEESLATAGSPGFSRSRRTDRSCADATAIDGQKAFRRAS